MPTPITPVSAPPTALPPLAPAPAPGGAGGGFGAVLANAIQGVEAMRHQSVQAVEKFLSGEGEELHTTVLATQRAELAFELFLQVRNKVVQAYQEIMRMQT
jgi:flagellar hook-basal body complex protein FliE